MKFKAKTRDCKLIVRVKLDSKDIVNHQQFAAFNNKCPRGFLRPMFVKENVLEYTGPVGISIFNRLKNPISRYDFFFIIEQIVDSTLKMQKLGLPWNKVVWDIHNVYFNNITKEVQLIYLPVESNYSQTNIVGFIENVVYSAIPFDPNDATFIQRFVYFLSSLNGYDPEKIENYIAGQEKSIVDAIKRNNLGNSGFMTDKPKDYYEHYQTESQPADTTDYEATGLLYESDIGSEETTLLNEPDYSEDTVLLNEPEVKYPILQRVSGGEEIVLDKPVFRIGKEKSYVDYFVTNNNTVSRSHADIIARNGKYYIMDLNSKNGTFINGYEIPVKSEIELNINDRITLSNEEFIFKI